MFNVLQKSVYMQSSATVGRTALWTTLHGTKKWGSMHIWSDPTTAESEGQNPYMIAATDNF